MRKLFPEGGADQSKSLNDVIHCIDGLFHDKYGCIFYKIYCIITITSQFLSLPSFTHSMYTSRNCEVIN